MHAKTGEIHLRGDMTVDEWEEFVRDHELVPVGTSPVAEPTRLGHGSGRYVGGRQPPAKDMRFARNRRAK